MSENVGMSFYDFLGKIDAVNCPYIGGIKGTLKLLESLNIQKKPRI